MVLVLVGEEDGMGYIGIICGVVRRLVEDVVVDNFVEVSWIGL